MTILATLSTMTKLQFTYLNKKHTNTEDSISGVNEPVISDKVDYNTLSTTNKEPVFAVRSQQMAKRKQQEKNKEFDRGIHAEHASQREQIAELTHESEVQ